MNGDDSKVLQRKEKLIQNRFNNVNRNMNALFWYRQQDIDFNEKTISTLSDIVY